MKKINLKKHYSLKQKKNLHSERHLLAEELSQYFGEPKKFAMYLGIIKKIGIRTTHRILSEIKQSNAKKPVKLFMYQVKQHNLKAKQKNGKTYSGNRKTQ